MDTKASILIVDDDPKLRKTLSDILQVRGYAPTAVATGEAALDRIAEEVPAVALIDLKLEDMPGLEVMRGIKERSPGTECIVLTGYATQKSAIAAVNLGAYSYVQKPYDMEQLLVTVRRAVEKREAEDALREREERFRQFFENEPEYCYMISPEGVILDVNSAALKALGYQKEELVGKPLKTIYAPESLPKMKQLLAKWRETGELKDEETVIITKKGDRRTVLLSAGVVKDAAGKVLHSVSVQKDITERKRAEEELRQSHAKLQQAFEGTVNVLVSAIEIGDPYTAGHQRRVTRLACAIAEEIGLPEERIEGLRMAGLVHDLGKTTVPAEILSKPGPLTDLEYGLIKMHSQIGHDVLKRTEFPWPVAEIVLQHHERMDGSGYPQGLSDDEIMLEARILAVSDVVEAMASHRPYRPPRGIDKALEEISQNRGVLYDPQVVDVCLKLFTEKGFEFERGVEV